LDRRRNKNSLFLFKEYINNYTLPSLKVIIIKTRNNILKNRQPAIKIWLHNQIRKKIPKKVKKTAKV